MFIVRETTNSEIEYVYNIRKKNACFLLQQILPFKKARLFVIEDKMCVS